MKRFLNIVSYDIQFSFGQNRLKWFFAVIIQLFLCIRSFSEVSFYSDSYDLLSELWSVMCGAREYFLYEDSFFQLPAYWFLFHTYLFFLIGFYPANELYLGNGQTLVRTHSKKYWLVSKLISVFLNIALYYGCFLTLLLIGNLLHGGRMIPANGIIGLSGILIFEQSILQLFTCFILLPLLISTVLGEIQIVMSLFFNPVLSFMIIVGYLIASVFWVNPLLIGNFSMLYRQEWVSKKPALSLMTAMMICFFLAIITFAVGVYVFQKKDILPSE